ncbi:LysR family transcriptional regulator [Limnohabitans radicicola]|uniref:LysR family transcriptional regulator n=1 Tax=Limnohabitans radicicola TaxID=2771427 RepID=A0A927ILD6_9BURK|nr:LysR family transcriptional regulator [Limnohabitans radicicola]MBD8050045.1 LysR family transcriptional regulator [Limnohabitans radicicola]
MRDLDLTSLRLFVTVCDTGNMSRAAEKANMVASAVSKRLAQLEATVGASLLTRRKHGVVPTAAGETLLEHARSMLLSASRIERDMASHAAGIQGRVNVLATASVMAESLADEIAEFLKQAEHQNIQIDLEERISPEVVRGIRDGVASIGICWDAAETGLLHTRTYRHDHLCVAVPHGHPLCALKELRFEDTLDFEHVIMPINSAVEVMLQREAGLLGKRLQHRVIVTNFEAALRVVRAGLAIALVPREVTGLYAEAYGLAVLPLQEPWSRRRFVLCHRGEEVLTPAALKLLDALSAAHTPASP